MSSIAVRFAVLVSMQIFLKENARSARLVNTPMTSIRRLVFLALKVSFLLLDQINAFRPVPLEASWLDHQGAILVGTVLLGNIRSTIPVEIVKEENIALWAHRYVKIVLLAVSAPTQGRTSAFHASQAMCHSCQELFLASDAKSENTPLQVEMNASSAKAESTRLCWTHPDQILPFVCHVH